MSLICPECHQNYNENVGCVNPLCKYKNVVQFATDSSEEEKQAILNMDHYKWSEREDALQTSPDVKGPEPTNQDPVPSIQQHPELGTKEEEEQEVNSSEYKLKWDTESPGHIVYVIDLSQSMGFNDGKNIKDVLEVVYDCLEDFVTSCTTSKGKLAPKLTATIIGYNSKVNVLFKGGIEQICELIDIDPEEETIFDITQGGEAFPQGFTKTAEAFDAAREDIEKWMNTQRDAHVPMPAPYVVHITDGHPELKENDKRVPEEELMDKALTAARRLKDIKTDDGHLLLFNIHYNTNGTGYDSEELVTPAQRPNGNSVFEKRRQFLFDASSILPKPIVDSIQGFLKRENSHILKVNVKEGSRAMISNTRDKDLLSKFVVFSSKTGMTRKTEM